MSLSTSPITRRLASIGAFGLIAAMAAPATAATVTVGSYDSGNCYPFSCLASDTDGTNPGTGTTYQQIYSASAFSGPLTINSVSFLRDTAGLMDSAEYRISFSTTSAAMGGLDSTWANNVGADSAVFGVFSVSGSMPSTLTFTGSAFNYNPSGGNLLMQVDILTLTEAHGYESYFQADYTGAVTQRLYAYGGSPVGDANVTGALVTQFNVTAVPEPETYALMLAGLGLLGFVARRRRSATAG